MSSWHGIIMGEVPCAVTILRGIRGVMGKLRHVVSIGIPDWTSHADAASHRSCCHASGHVCHGSMWQRGCCWRLMVMTRDDGGGCGGTRGWSVVMVWSCYQRRNTRLNGRLLVALFYRTQNIWKSPSKSRIISKIVREFNTN